MVMQRRSLKKPKKMKIRNGLLETSLIRPNDQKLQVGFHFG